eukprot:gene1374-32739_t
MGALVMGPGMGDGMGDWHGGMVALFCGPGMRAWHGGLVWGPGMGDWYLSRHRALLKVAWDFEALGILDGAVGLRGVIEPVGDDNATVKVLFDPPVLTLKDSLHLRIGPPSSVQLTTTYLDDRVRIGKGSRGSLFVFTRGGLADEAQMDIVGKQGTSKSALVAFSVFFVTLMLGGLGMWMSGHPVLRVGAVLGWLLGVGIATVVKEGGIIRGDNVTPAGKETPAGDVTPTVGATPV